MLRITLSCCLLYAAHACIPMNPGDELECPSPPKIARLRANTEDLEYYELKGPTHNIEDEEIYVCPFTMFSEGGGDKASSDNWQLVCKPNSGFFVIRDTMTHKETLPNPQANFACEEVPCNTKMIEYEGNIPAPYYEGGPIEIMKGSEEVIATCPKGSRLYMVTDVVTMVKNAAVPTCERNSGEWGGADKVYKCLKKTCNPPIIATTNTEYCPAMSMCDRTKLNPMPTTLISCTDDYLVSYSYVENSTTKGPIRARSLTCNAESGLWEPPQQNGIDTPKVTCVPPN